MSVASTSTRRTTTTELSIDLASASGTRTPTRLVLVAPGVLEVVDGPPELRGQWIGEDWFGAACQLRRRAEQLGLETLIAGAQAHVWPTLAQREAGGLTLTRLARAGDERRTTGTVDLFDAVPVGVVVSVREQLRSWVEWLQQPAPSFGPHEHEATSSTRILVSTPADDPRFEFVGATLGWWCLDSQRRIQPPFRYNPRLVRVADASERTKVAEVMLDHEGGEVRLRLWGAGVVGAVGRGVDAFVALAHLRERIANHGLRLLVQGARREAWRFVDYGETVTITPLGQTINCSPRRDLLDRAVLSSIATVDEQRLHRWMLHGSYRVPNDEVIAWAQAEPDSWWPCIWKGDARRGFGPEVVGWWRSDAWGRVVEFRPNPDPMKRAPLRSIDEMLRDVKVFTGPYPLECR